MPFAIPSVSGVVTGLGSGQKKNIFDRGLDRLGSVGGQTLLSGIGGAMSAYGESKQADANRAASGAISEAEMRQRQLENQQQDQRTRATTAAQLLPMGAEQGYAQKQALAKALLTSARNAKFTPGDPAIAQAMGSYTGGLRLPEGGLDPEMIERLYGGEATQAAIAAYQKNVGQVNPAMHAQQLDTLFGHSADGSENAFTTDVRTANKQMFDQQLADSEKQRAAVLQALQGAQPQKTSKAGSILGSIAKGAATILPFFL